MKITACKLYRLKLQTRNIFVFLFSCLIFSACHLNDKKEDLKDTSTYFNTFFNGNEESVLRNIDFNMNIDDVKKTEQSKLFESTADHLFYEFSFPTDSTAFSEYANIQYFFNENNQLDVITNRIYLNDTLQQEKLVRTLSQYFNEKFGDAESNSNKDVIWKGVFKDKTNHKKYDYTVSINNLEDDQDIDAIGVTVEYYLLR